MVSKKQKNKHLRYSLVSIIVLSIFFFGAYAQTYFSIIQVQEEIEQVETIEEVLIEEVLIEENIAYINIPALNQNEEGVSTRLLVKAIPGTGKTLLDIDSLLYWVDTQNSIRLAKLVAQNYTGSNLDYYDFTFSVDANASLIGGESAGAALAIATIAAIKDLKLKEDVMITGTINHDGSIGPIGGILQKAKAAKEAGITTLLVPLLQSKEITYQTNEHCETFGLMEWCTIEQIPIQIDITSEVGIEVIEIGSVEEALKYFV